ncbi:hypothetical protein KRR38_33650 [Novosphingobium sp. G106]|uniref:hypothetical protein n=1 Tax=Novosphingobium sp. G106 TaxID=2849500 RepID=UPI001C2D2F84|nr:hypothetical protein [Novosphingobium sp. G106]MBV1692450.1 hypothetical protein [Novosphingobium sp. G106]
MFEREGEGYIATAPHNDNDLWDLQIARAFGTRSQSVMRAFLIQLEALCTRAWDDQDRAWKTNESEFTAILSMVNDLQPRNTAEAGLAAQIVLIHLMVMRLGKQALNSGGMIMERDAALTGKLARTYAMLMETYQGLRGKRRTSKQNITVRHEKHVHHHQHVHLKGGTSENERQPHEPTAAAVGERAQMQGDEPRGQVLRLPGSKGKSVCRSHGAGGGGPLGPANGAWKHGGRSNDAIALRRAASRLLKELADA